MILALDIATATGVAHESGLLTTWDLEGVDCGVPHKHIGSRHAALRFLLTRLHDRNYFDRVVVEHSSLGTRYLNVAEFHGRLLGVVLCWAAERGIPVELVKPAELKRFATGSGAAKKNQMVATAKAMLGIDCEDDNQADAAWLLAFAKAKRDGQDVCSKTPATRKAKRQTGKTRQQSLRLE